MEYFDKQKGTEEWAMLGYCDEEAALSRYSLIRNILRTDHNVSPMVFSNVADIGAGVGLMWKAWDSYKPSLVYELKTRGLKYVVLIEPLEKYQRLLFFNTSEAIGRYANLNYLVHRGGAIDLPRIEPNGFDLIIEIGALNFHPVYKFYQFMEAMIAATNKVLIFETNFQTPKTPISDFLNYNPSFDVIYNFLFERFRRVRVDIIRQYTSIWTCIDPGDYTLKKR